MTSCLFSFRNHAMVACNRNLNRFQVFQDMVRRLNGLSGLSCVRTDTSAKSTAQCGTGARTRRLTGGYEPHWKMLPEAVKICQDLVSCKCRKGRLRQCSWKKADLQCTAVCLYERLYSA